MSLDATRTSPPDSDVDATRTGAVPKEQATLTLHTPATPGTVDAPPGFVIEKELGVGGMGVVYLARQVGLNRPVALKLVKGGQAVDAKALIRFLAEAEAVACIKHPNVVEVFQYGEHAGRPYMALEYCAGGDLTSLVRREPTASESKDASGFRRVAELMAQVAAGVNAAHAQGIVHRDLKPHNVFLTADGTPKVADFGLAKRGLGSDLTNTEAVMGTPAYMAPEQAGGGTKFVGPEADVWALGVMLYELCCGERPIDTTGPMMVALARVAHGQVSQLRTQAPTIPPDLALIAHKCLCADPRDRYPTAGGLAADLRNWLDGQPISVRPSGVIESAVKWVRRKPTLATAYIGSVAAVCLLFVVFILVSLWQQAENAKQLATQAQEKVARVEYGRTMQVAHQAWIEDNAAEATALLADTDPKFRGWEWDYLHRLCNGHVLEVKGVHAADLSASGTRLAAVCSSGGGSTFNVWDVQSGTKLFETPFPQAVHNNSVRFSEDGRRLLTASYGESVASARVWDTATGRELVNLPITSPFFARLTPDGNKVFAPEREVANVGVWDVESGKKLAELGGHTGKGVFGLEVTTDGSRAATRGEAEGSWRLWDLTGSSTPRAFDGQAGPVSAVEFSRDGKTLSTSTFQQTVLRDPSGRIRSEVPRENAGGGWHALSADGRRVVSAGENDTLHLWEEGKGQRWESPVGHTAGVLCLVFSADGRRVVTGSEDMTARVWDADTGKELFRLKGHTGKIERVAVGADGHVVFTQTAGTVRVWDTRSPAGHRVERSANPPNSRCWITWAGQRIELQVASPPWAFMWRVDDRNPPPESETPIHGALSRDGRRAAVCFPGGRLLLWDCQAGRAIATLAADFVVNPVLVFSPDGSKVFCSGKTTGQMWDANTGGKLGSTIQRENTIIASAAFSPDGAMLATGNHDTTARIHDATTGALIAELKGHGKSVSHLAFDPAGKRLATASHDNTIRLWDTATGKELAVMKGHTAEIASLAFHPDGNRIVTGAKDRTVRVWDTVSGAEVFTLKEAKSNFLGIFARFSDDGKELLTTSDGMTFKVWDSRPVPRGPDAK